MDDLLKAIVLIEQTCKEISEAYKRFLNDWGKRNKGIKV
jgi:hypothetical protein